MSPPWYVPTLVTFAIARRTQTGRAAKGYGIANSERIDPARAGRRCARDHLRGSLGCSGPRSERQSEAEPEDIALRAVLRVDVARVAEIDGDRAEIVADKRADRERLEAIAGRVAEPGEIRRRGAAVELVVLDLVDPESHDAGGPSAEALLHRVVDGHDVAGVIAQARREILVLGLDVEFEIGRGHEIAVEVADGGRRADRPGMVGDVDRGVFRPGPVAEIDRHVGADEEVG